MPALPPARRTFEGDASPVFGITRRVRASFRTTETATRSTCPKDSDFRYKPAPCSRTRPSSASTARVASLSSLASTWSSISLSLSARAIALTTSGAVASTFGRSRDTCTGFSTPFSL